MTTQEEIKFDRSLLGVEHPTGTFHVTKEMILGFARSVGETNPLFTDEEADQNSEHGGLIAPPSFCNLFISGTGRPDVHLEFGELTFFAGQALEYFTPVRPGDTLEGKTSLKEVYSKTGRSGMMVFVVWETTLTNQEGVKVAAIQESFVSRNRTRG